MPRKKIDFDVVRELGLELPDVTDATTDRGACLKLGGRIMACKAIHKSAEPSTLMVRISVTERDRLLEENPSTYYLTDHYTKHASVLVRLDRISRKALRDLLHGAWRYGMEKI